MRVSCQKSLADARPFETLLFRREMRHKQRDNELETRDQNPRVAMRDRSEQFSELLAQVRQRRSTRVLRAVPCHSRQFESLMIRLDSLTARRARMGIRDLGIFAKFTASPSRRRDSASAYFIAFASRRIYSLKNTL